jgi:hypothetical protein
MATRVHRSRAADCEQVLMPDLKRQQAEMRERQVGVFSKNADAATLRQCIRDHSSKVREHVDKIVEILQNSELLNAHTTADREKLRELLPSINTSLQLLGMYRTALARAAGVKAA